jgi:hydrogenase expression/formation protein HypC
MRSVCLAIPGRVLEIVDETDRLALVDVAGVRRTINVSLLDGDDGEAMEAGGWVLIHVGFALSRIDEREALATLDLLRQAGEEYEEQLRELAEGAVE